MALSKTGDESGKHYTYADYASWDDGERVEIIHGALFMMSPAPSIRHQAILTELARQLGNFLQGKPCKVLCAPVDVRLNADADDDTVVQPDILVVCDPKKLDGKCCAGAPDFIIEILSPATARRDKVVKLNAYRDAGVREYWIVDPDTKSIQTHRIKEGEYIVRAYGDTDQTPVQVLDGCIINLTALFAEE